MNGAADPMEPKPSGRVVILGIGNTLLADEGVGIHAMRELQRLCPDRGDIELIDGGTLSFNLLPAIEMARSLIVIDAANLGEAPGSFRCFSGDEFDDFLGKARHTAHEIGLRELLDMASLNGWLPRRRALIGVQPLSVDWGEMPTQAVAAVIPTVASLALRLADQWCSVPIEDGSRV